MTLLCTHCGSNSFRKNGTYQGIQRYRCHACQRFFSDKPRKFTYQTKVKAIDMYLNNVGIRKIARFIQCSPSLILRWIRAFSQQIAERLEQARQQAKQQVPDIIEMDELYTYVKKTAKSSCMECLF